MRERVRERERKSERIIGKKSGWRGIGDGKGRRGMR